jgi:hypothetical protein
VTTKKFANFSVFRLLYLVIPELFFYLFCIWSPLSAIRFIVRVENAARPQQSLNRLSDNPKNILPSPSPLNLSPSRGRGS